MWFSLTRPCGMKRAVAQVSWGDTEARLHRAFVRTLNLVQREHEPLKDFKQEKDMFIFSAWKDHPDPQIGGDKTQTRETIEESVDKCRCKMIIA